MKAIKAIKEWFRKVYRKLTQNARRRKFGVIGETIE